MSKPVRNSPPLAVTFWGAARTVTGSMHLVEVGRHSFLLDCGLYQGRRAAARERNSTFPFDPRRLDAVLLSHAHIDHCGNLPNLVRQGFCGNIFCTPATRDLAAVMLADSAKIQQEDAAFLNKRREAGQPRVEALYDHRDVRRTMHLTQPVGYERDFALGRGLHFRFVEAGHLLGSAMIQLTISAGGQQKTLTFTGDLGRRGLPILRDPAPVPPADLVISECTYGGRTHPPVELLASDLKAVIERTFARGGKLLIPAFSLGRTQNVLYVLHQLIAAGDLKRPSIFVDSPLAASATEVFRIHPECFDEETSLLLADQPDLFGERLVRYTRSVEESKKLNARTEPCIIVAASGMCESGRILHHLKNNIENERTTVLVIGYQAPDTLGRRIVERRPQVRILDRYYQLRAEVVQMEGFSSHADHRDLLAALGPLSPATRIRLVHGEAEAAQALLSALGETGFADVAYPARGESVRLGGVPCAPCRSPAGGRLPIK